MGKWQNDAMLDAGLAYLTTNGTELYVCTAQPTDRANAIALALCSAQTPSFTGPLNGDVDGRKVTVDAITGIPVTATGTATHIAICSGSLLIYVTTCASQAVTSGGTMDMPAWDGELGDGA